MKIYVTDLAAYNEGKLDGFWLDIEFLDEYDIENKIEEFLEKQSEKYGVEREEVFITDYDDMPSFGEYPDYSKIADYVRNVDQVGEEVAQAAQELEVDVEDYFGYFDSYYDLGYELAESNGILGNDQSSPLVQYFDFARYGEDEAQHMIEYNGQFFLYR